jgi:hypothetical protein
VQPGTRLTIRLGIAQIIGWGSSFYLPAILAVPIAQSLGITTELFFWAFTISLLVSGLLGPRVGKAIDRLGGRKVLPLGSLAFVLGLGLLATATEPVQLFLAWIFIAGITVFAGFSSSISWPLTTLLLAEFGWQWAVWFWVATHLLIGLPLNLTIPRSERRDIPDMTGPIRKMVKNKFRFDSLLVVFAIMFALEGFIVSSVNTTLPFMLGELGASIELALVASIVLGPSQVMARVLLLALGKWATPIRVAAISIAAHPLGVMAIWLFGTNGLMAFVILHGIGVGLNPFIRGSLPLLFFGSDRFGQRQGYIMMLSKVVSALSPTLLTLMLLANPQLAIIATFTMGVIACLLLVWIYLLFKARNPKHPETGSIQEIN